MNETGELIKRNDLVRGMRGGSQRNEGKGKGRFRGIKLGCQCGLRVKGREAGGGEED